LKRGIEQALEIAGCTLVRLHDETDWPRIEGYPWIFWKWRATVTAAPPRFASGALVRARGRDWVVLPPTEDPELLLLRPLGGTDEDAVGLYIPLEGNDVVSATLPPPDPVFVGDAVSASLLRDAVRFGFRWPPDRYTAWGGSPSSLVRTSSSHCSWLFARTPFVCSFATT